MDKTHLSRIFNLSDGVFAIVISLLVFEVRLPNTITPDLVLTDSTLMANIFLITPKLISYCVTFFVVGVYWIGHHAVCKHVVNYSRGMIWINNLFLMCICFLPFPTYILGAYYYLQTSVIIYGLSLIFTGLSLLWLWHYVTTNKKLCDESVTPELIKMGKQRILIAPLLSLISIVVSFLNVKLSLWIYVLGGLLYLLPSKIDKQ